MKMTSTLLVLLETINQDWKEVENPVPTYRKLNNINSLYVLCFSFATSSDVETILLLNFD